MLGAEAPYLQFGKLELLGLNVLEPNDRHLVLGLLGRGDEDDQALLDLLDRLAGCLGDQTEWDEVSDSLGWHRTARYGVASIVLQEDDVRLRPQKHHNPAGDLLGSTERLVLTEHGLPASGSFMPEVREYDSHYQHLRDFLRCHNINTKILICQ